MLFVFHSRRLIELPLCFVKPIANRMSLTTSTSNCFSQQTIVTFLIFHSRMEELFSMFFNGGATAQKIQADAINLGYE
jgi:hypothetical protein